MSSATVTRAIAAIAASQHDIVSRQQLLGLGLSRDAVAHRIANGWLHPVFPGVYSVGTPVRTPLRRAAAAVLACGDHAWLSGASAMCLWGFWRRWPDPIEVVITHGNRRRDGIVVHRSRALQDEDLTVQLGIRVTSPAWTVLDTTPRIGNDDKLARTVDNALHALVLTRGMLAETVLRNPLHPGKARLMTFVTREDGPSRSDWERAFPAFCAAHGLPRPLLSVQIGRHHTADALFPDARLIVELDSWRSHSGPHAFERDRERDAQALLIGLATVRITWKRMFEASMREAARLRAIIDQRTRTRQPA